MHRHLSTPKNADRQDHRVSEGSSPTLSRPPFPAPLLKNSDDGDDAVPLHAAPAVVACCFPMGSSCVLRSRLVVSKSTAIAPITSSWDGWRRSSASAVSFLSSSKTLPCCNTVFRRSPTSSPNRLGVKTLDCSKTPNEIGFRSYIAVSVSHRERRGVSSGAQMRSHASPNDIRR